MNRGERPIPLSVLISSIKGYDNMVSLVNGGSFSSSHILDCSNPNQVVLKPIDTDIINAIRDSITPLRSLVSLEQ